LIKFNERIRANIANHLASCFALDPTLLIGTIPRPEIVCIVPLNSQLMAGRTALVSTADAFFAVLFCSPLVHPVLGDALLMPSFLTEEPMSPFLEIVLFHRTVFWRSLEQKLEVSLDTSWNSVDR